MIKKVCFGILSFLSILVVLVCLYSVYLKEIKYKNKSIVAIKGGLGNQLYQYAFGYTLHKNTGKEILFDLSYLDREQMKKKPRKWVIDFVSKFNVPYRNFIHQNPIENWLSRHILDEYISGVVNDFKEELLKKNTDVFFNSYYQNPLYFKQYEKDIKEMFTTLADEYKSQLDEKNQNLIKEMQSHKNSVVINIRLGDFLSIQAFNVCSWEYYKRAMQIFDKMEDVHYYIFSDDIEGVKAHFKTDKPHTFVDINPLLDAHLNLILSSSAKHNIVSNSTFAIWAGMLNKNPNKIVVRPGEYMIGVKDNEQIYPKEWIRIDTSKDEKIDIKDIKTEYSKEIQNIYKK